MFFTAAPPALADVRESATFTNINSDATPVGKSLSFTGGYLARNIRISGTLKQLLEATRPEEAQLTLLSPGFVPRRAFPAGFQDFDAAGTVVVNRILRLDTPLAAGGTWVLASDDTNDDGPGTDAVWTSLTIALDDGVVPPPPADDLGTLPNTGAFVDNATLSPRSVRWYKFTLPHPVNARAGTYLDLSTKGASLRARPNPARDSRRVLGRAPRGTVRTLSRVTPRPSGAAC